MSWLIAFFLMALTAAATIAFWLQETGRNWTESTLIGAGMGVVFSDGFVSIAWHLFMRLFHGAPFHVGDRVEILTDPFQGKKAEVHRLCEGRTSVIVKLFDLDASPIQPYDWAQIRRLDNQTENLTR
ncbi:transcription elongation factor Spt5 [Tuwongella immobilis]|uniref:Uncharacterized protein n=1 Tax=Tuwongella immobilis TaxID=692036 RepID=A0A6C2YKB0_9BACT|nr:hypothetical protein [Tuwongella immobilis]VIP01866.1 unnamed protein product [Tuwongella immobilis]VTR99686.1 unnamed protein product [Tuwongella immobilis]